MKGVLRDKQLTWTCTQRTSLKQEKIEGMQATWAGELLEGGGVEGRWDRGWGGDPALPAAALPGLVCARSRCQSAGQITVAATCLLSTLKACVLVAAVRKRFAPGAVKILVGIQLVRINS